MPNVLDSPLEPQRDVRAVVGPHVATRQFLQRPESLPAAPDRVFVDNNTLWKTILQERVRALMTVELRDFFVTEWLPRAPGLYFTETAAWARQTAMQHVTELRSTPPVQMAAAAGGVQERAYRKVFSPFGKFSMLEGGVGCIRLKPLSFSGEAPFWLMSASSSGVAHEGFPLAMPQHEYERLVNALVEHGGLRCSVVGKLRFLPAPLSHLVDQYGNVPALYLDVEEVRQGRQNPLGPDGPEVSVVVSFASAFEGRPQVYASYVSFNPADPGGLDRAANWLKHEYVEGGYQGRILTDFDQTRVHFPEAALSLRRVMRRHVHAGDFEDALDLISRAAYGYQIFQPSDLADLLPGEAAVARTQVFVSYSHRDATWLNRVKVFLTPLVRDHSMDFVSDLDVQSGEKWHDRIDGMIDSSSVAILLMTADFLASEFIASQELPRLLARAEREGLVVLPVFIGSGLLPQEIARIQGIGTPEQPLNTMSPGEQDRQFTALARRVQSLVTARR